MLLSWRTLGWRRKGENGIRGSEKGKMEEEEVRKGRWRRRGSEKGKMEEEGSEKGKMEEEGK